MLIISVLNFLVLACEESNNKDYQCYVHGQPELGVPDVVLFELEKIAFQMHKDEVRKERIEWNNQYYKNHE